MKKYNVGLIGAGFMAKAHSIAYAAMPMFFWPAPGIPVKKIICDLTEEGAKDAAARFGFENYTTKWQEIINDPDIDIIDIATPNDSHAEIAIAAAEAGKHIFCEKPIARTKLEAEAMLKAAKLSGVVNMLAFNYRRTPAITLAKKFIDEGAIGNILTFRGTYLQDWSADPNVPLSWRFQKSIAGTGALGDIGTHVIDIARYLVGDIDEVCGLLNTYIHERSVQNGSLDKLGTVKSTSETEKALVDVDDEVSFMVKFKNGSTGSIEATRNGWGRNNYITFEIHGDKGSIFFNYERRDELQVYFADDSYDRRGFRTIYTGPAHPNGEALWPIPALGIGYTETKIVECYDFIKAIKDGEEATPNFNDGYNIELICDAIIKSSKEQKWVKTGC
ncbi:Gfo/Idh/MocA family protein [Alkalibacter saccharofermentans]|uniref:Predicted dehydrogenase n=1 Tax=Alkalibacter saccharofermentans DSM 14828 TaxID=1120975 RepID=A0A1M4UT33_9FIRM|nr:Gfo/Idh/MocA family oxidoreductase [Alkalibacter saccharofermentans]SHE59839.1 Predicted dehydrogenase [Alkalibacter saccharofermentans DSM 14828]